VFTGVFAYTSYMIPFKDLSQSDAVRDLYKEEEEELVKMLSDKYGLPYVDLRTLAPEPDALRLVKEDVARSAGMVAFKMTGHKLYVAILTPNNKYGRRYNNRSRSKA
jgi:hypothetical protein